MPDVVGYQTKDHAVYIEVRRPESKNALNLDALNALIAALERANQETDARSVVVSGQGGDFSAGGDIKDMLARRGKGVATYERLRAGLGRLVSLLIHHEKPIIAAVDGACLGAGLGLALASDLLIATQRSTFGAPFVKVGLVPDTGTSWLLPHVVGVQNARRLLLTGESIDAETAAGLGLVTRLVPDVSALAAAVTDATDTFARLPATAPRDAKRLFWANIGLSLEVSVAHEAMMQGVRFTTKDHADAVDAFVAKRGGK